MTCQCCEGLMVLERYDDLELGSAGYEVSAWRCLNCGAIVDSGVADHRPTVVPATEETGDDDIRDVITIHCGTEICR